MIKKIFQTTMNRFVVCLVASILTIFLTTIHLSAQTNSKNIYLTEEEKDWLSKNNTVKVAAIKSIPPYISIDNDGNVSGIKDARDIVVADLKRNREIDRALNPPPIPDPDAEPVVIAPEPELILPDPIIKPKLIAIKKSINNGPMQITSIKTGEVQVEHYSYLLEWAGKKLYFSGDTGDIEHLATLPELDIAFLSPWLFENARKGNALPNAKKLSFISIKMVRLFPTV
jgi:hypothetical protein